MSLKYTCPGCGTPLGYEGLCWKCKCEQERNAALAWTPEQVATKQRNLIQNIRRLSDFKDPERTDFWQLLGYRDAITPEIQRAALAAEETVLEDPAVVVFRREIIRMTMEVLRELPGKQRAALWMVYGMNLSIKEAAIKLKVPENTVKSRLFRGRQRFLERSEAFVEMGVFLTPAALPSLIAMAFAGRELFGDNLNQY